MKRFSLLLLVCGAGFGAYFWHTGDLAPWLRAAWHKARSVTGTDPLPAEVIPEPSTTRLDAEMIAALEGEDADARYRAWGELSRVWREHPERRDRIVEPLERYVNRYILSPWREPRVADYVHVKPGDNLSRLSTARRSTADATRRINHLPDDTIHPGQTLKILNQPIEIFVEKSQFRLWVAYGGRFLQDMPCGIGRDNRTLTGVFEIDTRKKNPDWFPPGRQVVPAGDPENELGSRWLGFKATPQARGLGIHEARANEGIGQAISQGCVRLSREDVELLFDLTPLGTLAAIRD